MSAVDWLGDHLPDSFRTEKHTSDVGFKLAIFHSLFNLMNICLLIAFVPQIARLVTKWVKEPEPSEEESSPRLRFISSSMVDIGELNIPEAEKATLELAGITKEMFEGYLAVFNDPNTDLSAEVKRLKALEDDADVLTHDITEYLVRTSAANLSAENARSVGRMAADRL